MDFRQRKNQGRKFILFPGLNSDDKDELECGITVFLTEFGIGGIYWKNQIL
jgi:hypothetical protein